jgi:peptidoglycan endopeptidase LytE
MSGRVSRQLRNIPLITLFFLFSLAVTAQASLHYTVKKGDTLSGIARKFGVSVRAIRHANAVDARRLKPGSKIVLPAGKAEKRLKRKGRRDAVAKQAAAHAAAEETALNAVSPSGDLSAEGRDGAVRAETNREKAEEIEEDLKETASSGQFRNEDEREKLITFARELLNIPYKFGGNSILGIDCSAYVKKVYGLLGIDLPRTAREQFREGGEAVDKDHLSIGDLVFFRTYASFPSHVGIYLGNNLFIHASSKVRKVTIDSLETPYYLKRFIGGRRLLTEDSKDSDQ